MASPEIIHLAEAQVFDLETYLGQACRDDLLTAAIIGCERWTCNEFFGQIEY